MKFIDFLDIYLTGIENIFPQTRVAKSIGEKNRNVRMNLVPLSSIQFKFIQTL